MDMDGSPIHGIKKDAIPFLFAYHGGRRDHGAVRNAIVKRMDEGTEMTVVLCSGILGSGFDMAIDLVVNARLPEMNDKEKASYRGLKTRVARAGR